MTEHGALKDFFISYNNADRAWAEWIARQLQVEGYTVQLQIWDFRPGGNFVLQMQEDITGSKRTIAVLSPDYLDPKAGFSHAEWAAAFVEDPEGRKAKLLPVRVHECKPTGLLATITYIDLVNKNEEEARNDLIAGVRRSRNLPSVEPLYPGGAQANPSQPFDFPGEWPVIWNVPYNRNRLFTGRKDILLNLHNSLTSVRSATSIQMQALSGLGGIGKTQAALQYAYSYGHEYRSVLWVSAVTSETLDSGIVQLATTLQLPEDSARDPQEAIDAVKRWLSRQRDWLLILDNADDLRGVSKILPQGARTNGHVLLTTRASAGRALAQMIDLDKMDLDEGTLFLLRRIGTLLPEASLEQANLQDRSNAEAIVRQLDGLPLAIDQAGAYIEEIGTTPSDYLKLYQTRHADLLKRRGHFSPDHPETVATTWSLSFQKVAQDNLRAADLLRLLSFLAPDAIPESLLAEGVDATKEEAIAAFADPFELNEAIEVLRRFSFVRRSPDAKVISIHRLVQVMLKDVMSEDIKKQWSQRVVLIVNTALPKVNFQRFDLYQKYFSHAQVATELIDTYQLSFLEAAQLLYKVGWYLREQGKYEQSGSFYERALVICKKELGLQHRETAAALEGRGTIYFHLGKYEEAQELLEQALAAHDYIQGAELEKAVTLNNLANLYQVQGKYEEAESLLKQALDINGYTAEAELEKAVVLSNLANLHLMQGQYEEAEEFLRQALDIHEHITSGEAKKTASPETSVLAYPLQEIYTQADLLFKRALSIHEKTLSGRPSTIATLLYFANLYQAQGKYKEAETLYRHALNVQEQAFGLEHPSAGGILHGLASLYQAQGRNKEAEQFYLRAANIQESALGSTHPNMVGVLQGLASLYQAQEKYKEAEQLYQRILNIVMQLFGSEHVNTGGVLQGLASLYQAQGNYEGAEQLYQHTLNIVMQRFGAEHTNTGSVLQGLASLYQAQEKYEEAEELYLRALSIQEKVLGAEHPSTGWVLQGLADLYQTLKSYEVAESLNVRNLGIQEKALGAEHLYVGWIVQRLANLYQAQEKYEQAELAYKRAIHIQENALGAEHSEVVGMLQALANLYYIQKRYGEAESLYRHVLHIKENIHGSEHVDISIALYNLGMLYEAQEQYKEASQFYRQAWHIVKQVWGPEYHHMKNMVRLQSRAEWYEEQEDYKEASLFYQRILNVERPERLKMYVGEDLIPTFDPEQGGVMLKLIQDIRDQLVEEQGFVLPSIRIQDSQNIDKNEYEVLIDGQTIMRRKILSNFALLKESNGRSRINGVETREPGYDAPVLWITKKSVAFHKKVNGHLLTPEAIICANMKKVFIDHQDMILGEIGTSI